MQVVRVLPDWLSKPRPLGQDLIEDGCSIQDMAWLEPNLLTKLKNNGIQKFFPVQKAIIPEIVLQESELDSW